MTITERLETSAPPVRLPGETMARAAARHAWRAVDATVPRHIPGVSQSARDALADHVYSTAYESALTDLTTT